MPHPIVPFDEELTNAPIDEVLARITKGDVVRYLNEVLEYYGPPCEFCRNFEITCEKGIRNRKYSLRIGMYDEWHIRKFCPHHEGKSNAEDDRGNQNEKLCRSVRNSLNCAAQQYGSGC